MLSTTGNEHKCQRVSSNTLHSCALVLPLILVCILAFTATALAQEEWPQVVNSSDGTPISYEVYGEGGPTLVFVHGWNCDARYWRNQVEHFSGDHQVVMIDLAGHGHSGVSRDTYSMRSFGEDVVAVTKAVADSPCILIGHSMGGVVVAQAARLMPERVIGIIGVDTLQNVEYRPTQEGFDAMMVPFKSDFRAASRGFVESMFRPDSDPLVREWILQDMPAAPAHVAVSALEEMMSLYITGEMAAMFKEIPVPVVAVNADLWPTDAEANRRHMESFDAIIIKNSDHFLMLNRAEEFNSALEDAIGMIMEKQGK